MSDIDITYEQARERVARALYADNYAASRGADAITRRAAEQWFDDLDKWTIDKYRAQADAALTVLWPVVEGLRAELAHARSPLWGPYPLQFQFPLEDDHW